MRYESLLAGRYIKAQKRQSFFTVISIAVAIASMVIIFALYSVFLHNYRNAVYESEPYHLLIVDWPENKATALRNAEHVKSVNFEWDPYWGLTAMVLFDENIGGKGAWMTDMLYQIDPALSPEQLSYAWNDELVLLDAVDDNAVLNRFLIFWGVLIFALLFAFSLRLVVDTFEISSKERERHYGVLQSIGATPRQIVGIITREGLRLCLIAIPLGLGVGLLMAFGMYRAIMDIGLEGVLQGVAEGKLKPSFSVDPLMLPVSAVVGLIWTFLSAYGVGMRVVRKTPMEAITDRSKRVKRVKKLYSLSGLLFGLPGRLAVRNARRQKKRFVATVVTLTVSLTLFSVFTIVTDKADDFVSEYLAVGGPDFDAHLSLIDTNTGVNVITLNDALDAITDSGLFREVTVQNVYSEIEINDKGYEVKYLQKEEYEWLLGEDAPLSYEAFAQSGGYLLNRSGSISWWHEDGSEYDGSENAWESYPWLSAQLDGEQLTACFNWGDKAMHKLKVVGEVDSSAPHEAYVPSYALYGAYDNYDPAIGVYLGEIWVELYSAREGEYSVAEYQKILNWFRSHSDFAELGMDQYGQHLKVQGTLSAVRAGLLFLNFLIALAALINLLNIVSTGISNRRVELASLQCVGMTDGQLYRMAFAECLQYVWTATAISSALCAMALYGTRQLVFYLLFGLPGSPEAADMEGDVLVAALLRMDWVTPFLRIALASALALAAAFAASVRMLRSQNRQALAEQIRGSDLELNISRSEID